MHGAPRNFSNLRSDGTPPPLFPAPLQFFTHHCIFFFYHNHYWRINFINIMSWKVRLYSSAAVFVMSNRRHGSLCSPWNFSISQSPQLENYECHQNDRICYLGLAGHNSVPDLRVRLMPMTETGDRCFMKRII